MPDTGDAHASPHFMRHPITDDNWCECPCSECCGHVEGLEGLDCMCEPCGCHLPPGRGGVQQRDRDEEKPWLTPAG